MLTIELYNLSRAAIINDLLGQLSDGYWESNPSYKKYWSYASVSGSILKINNENYSSGFRGKDEDWIKNWFASKLKELVQYEVGNNKQGWTRDNLRELDFLDVTVSECYELYDFLKGRKGHKYAYTDIVVPSKDEVEYKAYKNMLLDTINAKLDELNFKQIAEVLVWKESIIEAFSTYFTSLSKGGYNQDFFSELYSDIHREEPYIRWVSLNKAEDVIKNSNVLRIPNLNDLCKETGYSTSYDSLFKVLYFTEDDSVSIRRYILDSIDYYFTKKISH